MEGSVHKMDGYVIQVKITCKDPNDIRNGIWYHTGSAYQGIDTENCSRDLNKAEFHLEMDKDRFERWGADNGFALFNDTFCLEGEKDFEIYNKETSSQIELSYVAVTRTTTVI